MYGKKKTFLNYNNLLKCIICIIVECDGRIKNIMFQKSGPAQNGAESPEKQYVKSNKNNLSFDAKEILQQITGTDITEIFGINDIQPQ